MAGKGAALALLLMTALTPAQAVQERFYTILLEGRHAGYARYRIETARRTRTTTAATIIRATLLGAPQDLSYQSVAVHSHSGSIARSFALTFRRNADETTTRTRVTGASATTAITERGATRTTKSPWTNRTYVVSGNCIDTWNAMFSDLGPKAGGASIGLFEPLSGQTQNAKLSAGRREHVIVNGRRRAAITYTLGTGPGRLEFAVSRATREILEFRVPGQRAVMRLADRSATKGVAPVEALTRAFALTDAMLPEPSTATLLRVRVTAEINGPALTSTTIQSGSQRFTGTTRDDAVKGIFEIRPLVYTGARSPLFDGRSPDTPALRPHLRPENGIECTDPAVVSLAKTITAGAKTDWEAVQRIGRWISANITYAITGSGAKQCLMDRKGDCGPHTWLSIAMCRAVGIPARVTGGLLYSKTLGGSFGQHYWTRVWMGADGWVPIDTTTGEVGTLSPYHITLWDLAAIGSVQVDVLDFAPKAVAARRPVSHPRKPIVFTAGASELWVFTADGAKIGQLNSVCRTVRTVGSRTHADWSFALGLDVTSPTGAVKVDTSGALTVDDLGYARSLEIEATVNGVKQKAAYTFADTAVNATIWVGDAPVKRTVPIDGPLPTQINNLISLFGYGVQTLGIQPGQKLSAAFFAAGPLQRLDLDFAARGDTETIVCSGRRVECVVCDVAPIANRIYLDRTTGRLMRIVIDAQNITIERQ